MKAARLLCALLLIGCAGTDPERAGDVAWHAARWTDAVAAYRASGDSPRVIAKLADALLQSGALVESAEAWTRLGTEAPDRADEAAAGLERIAELAAQDGRDAPLAAAILGLRRVSPMWPVGRLAGRLGRNGGLTPEHLADLVPALLAGVQDRAAGDTLLLKLGQAERARGACNVAVPLLQGVARRASGAEVRDVATDVLIDCEVTLGLAALQGELLGEAERWLDLAAHQDPASVAGRRAMVGFGDARIMQGDTAAARAAWQVAYSAVPPDSVSQMALTRLAKVNPVATGDTNIPHPVRP